MPDLVRLTDERRNEIGQLIYEWVQAGLSTEGAAPDWWDAVERYHRNEPPSDKDSFGNGPDSPKYTLFQVPLSQPRQDMLTAQVCTVIGRQEPYMRETTSQRPVADAKAQLLHRVWQDAGFEDRIRDVSQIVGNTDLGYLKVELGQERGTIDMGAYHPRNVVVYPALPTGTTTAACVGNRLSRVIREVEDLRESGAYYKGTALPPGDPTETMNPGEAQRSGASYAQTAGDQATLTVNLWDLDVNLSVKEGEPRRWYHAVITDHGELLHLSPSPWTRPRWIRCQFIGSPTDFYSARSVGRNLYPLQDLYNKLWTSLYVGLMRAAAPPMVGPQTSSGEKNVSYPAWGAYVGTVGQPAGWNMQSTFPAAAIQANLVGVERIADLVARISQNTQGGELQGATATEASIVAAGVAVGLEEYIANFTAEFDQMARLTCEMIAYDYSAFAQKYGEQEEVEPPEDPEAQGLSQILEALSMMGAPPEMPEMPDQVPSTSTSIPLEEML